MGAIIARFLAPDLAFLAFLRAAAAAEQTPSGRRELAVLAAVETRTATALTAPAVGVGVLAAASRSQGVQADLALSLSAIVLAHFKEPHL